MKRYYTVTMNDDNVYGIPAEIIADNYAKYCASKGEDYMENFKAMIAWYDANEYKFADWAKNNMDWDDVADQAILLRTIGRKRADYQECWVNGEYGYERVED